MDRSVNEITGIIVDAAIKVHGALGPGLLEGVYLAVLAIELRKRGLKVELEVPIRLEWEGQEVGVALRADMIVEDAVIVEGKATEENARVNLRQLRTYVKLAKLKIGLLLNFGMSLMKEGIFRHAEGLEE